MGVQHRGAHYSNVTGGESVNCKQSGQENNDIHIVVAEKEQDRADESKECDSVTAEMSPHFRPAAWNQDDLNARNTHLFRFTGQLFFDASHRPCSGNSGSPKRSSIWEIPPVYNLEICGSANNSDCKIDSDENWISFAEAAGSERDETRLLLRDEI